VNVSRKKFASDAERRENVKRTTSEASSASPLNVVEAKTERHISENLFEVQSGKTEKNSYIKGQLLVKVN
jgi:hypothetical protein